jgi:hypothetical protein
MTTWVNPKSLITFSLFPHSPSMHINAVINNKTNLHYPLIFISSLLSLSFNSNVPLSSLKPFLWHYNIFICCCVVDHRRHHSSSVFDPPRIFLFTLWVHQLAVNHIPVLYYRPHIKRIIIIIITTITIIVILMTSVYSSLLQMTRLVI